MSLNDVLNTLDGKYYQAKYTTSQLCDLRINQFSPFPQIVSYEGKARAALKEAMIQYQAKSGRFDETNPWKRDGFKSMYCCTKFNMCDEGSSKTSGFTRMSISVTWTMTLVWTLTWSYVFA